MPLHHTLVAATLLLAAFVPPAPAESLYQVGNSFTADSEPFWLDDLALANGLTFMGGAHVMCNSSLNDIASNPDASLCTPTGSYGPYADALAGYEWDAIALQSYRKLGATLEKEALAGKALIDLARNNAGNLDSAYYLYEAWGHEFGDGSQSFSHWEEPYDPAEGVVHRRAYFEQLIEEWHGLTGVDVRMLPAGEALFRVREAIAAGEMPGIHPVWLTAIYRDNLHLSAMGKLVAGMTVLAALTGEDPRGWVVPPEIYFSDTLIPEQIAKLQEIVYETLVLTPNTGYTLPGDYNRDGVTDAADYVVWRDLSGSASSYTAWAGAYTPEGLAPAGVRGGQKLVVGLPEPSAGLGAGVLLAGLQMAGSRRPRSRRPPKKGGEAGLLDYK